MARVVNRLSAVGISHLKEPGLYPDGNGLYLRVTETKSRHWVFRFKRNKRTRYMGLGPVSDVTLAQARQLAATARSTVKQGADPIDERASGRVGAAEPTQPTFKDCAEALISAHEPTWKNSKHRAQWRNTLATYVYPRFGQLSVASIDTTAVLSVIEPIWHQKPETASRIRGRIEAVLNYAKARGLRDGLNPAQWRGHLDSLLPAKSKVRRVRHHPALPYTEIPAFMERLQANTSISARALEFVVLTAARTSEALGALWEEFDLDAGLWTVPPERMKSARQHRVPLSGRAVEILRELEEVQRGPYVFTGARSGRPLTDMALLMLLRGMREGVTTHGFRSTFKDWTADCTHVPNFVSEAALAHVVADRVEAAYRRTDLFEKRRELMEEWERYCLKLSNRKPPSHP